MRVQIYNNQICLWKLFTLICIKYFCITKNLIMEKFREIVEYNIFGVCTVIGEKIGIASSRIRTWFIYATFLTMGSPIIVYMILAFWINLKNYIKLGRRNPLEY